MVRGFVRFVKDFDGVSVEIFSILNIYFLSFMVIVNIQFQFYFIEFQKD